MLLLAYLPCLLWLTRAAGTKATSKSPEVRDAPEDGEEFPLECVRGWHRGELEGDASLLPADPDPYSLSLLGLERCFTSTFCYRFQPDDYAYSPVTYFGCSDDVFNDRCKVRKTSRSPGCYKYADFSRQMTGELCCCNDESYCNSSSRIFPILPPISFLWTFLLMHINQ